MDCKRALQETGGDFDEAVKLLREKGMAPAAKRADRETSEGQGRRRWCATSVGSIVAVGCETEPVSKNDEFLAFAEERARGRPREGADAAAGSRRSGSS